MKKTHLTALLAGLGIFAGNALAGEPAKEVIVPVEPKGFCDYYDDLFGLLTFYKGDGPLIQEIKAIGRYHGQYHDTESPLGDDSDWENRRFRFGLQVKFLKDFKLKAITNLKRDFSSSDDLFQSMEEINIEWAPSDQWALIVGKQKPAITREYSTSSKKIKTIERSQLVNQIVPDKSGGVWLEIPDVGGFALDIAGFTGGVTDTFEMPDFEGSYGVLARIGRDITDATEVRFDYMHQDFDEDNDQWEPYSNIFSLNSQSDWDKMHLVTDLIYATGDDGRADVGSVVFMPYYDLTEHLELVFRYTFSAADEDDGLNVQSRYERRAAGRLKGDEYHAFYGGLNWYICGDKLKIMNGVEYSDLSGADSNDYWSYLTGVRLYW